MTELVAAGESGGLERLLPSGCGYVISARSGDEPSGAFLIPMGSGPGLFVGLLEPLGEGLGAARLVVDGVMPVGTRLDVRMDADAAKFEFPVPHLGVISDVPPGASERRVTGLPPGDYAVTATTGGSPPFGYVIPVLRSDSVTILPGQVTDVEVQLVPAGLIEVTVEPTTVPVAADASFLVEYRRAGESEWTPHYVMDPSGGPPRGNIAPNKVHVTIDTLRAGPLSLRGQSSGWTSLHVPAEVRAGETTRYQIPVTPKDQAEDVRSLESDALWDRPLGHS